MDVHRTSAGSDHIRCRIPSPRLASGGAGKLKFYFFSIKWPIVAPFSFLMRTLFGFGAVKDGSYREGGVQGDRIYGKLERKET